MQSITRGRKLFLFFLNLLLSVIIPSAALAKDVAFEASLDRNIISTGEAAQLNLQFQGATDIPAPSLPEIDGLQIRYAGPSTMMSIVNGRMSSSITHIYHIIPLKNGKFQIGPIRFDQGGKTYSSNPLMLEVQDRPSGGGGPTHGQKRPETELRDKVFVKMQAGKSRPYINEVVPLTIKLYANNIGLRDIQFPELKPKDVSAGSFEKPRQYQEQVDGITYDVVEFKTQLFGTRAGEIRIDPVKIKANVISRQKRRIGNSMLDNFFIDDFFGSGLAASPVELSSNVLTLSVQPFPERKPDDFSGAVGDFNLKIEASPSEVKTGDPVTLRMTVAGNGNFNTVTSPVLKKPDGFKAYEAQAKVEGDKKIFEQVLIPMSDAVSKLPEVIFSFFNPVTGKYQIIAKGGVPIKVTKSANTENAAIIDAPQSGEKPIRKEVYGKDLSYIKETMGSVGRNGGYLYDNTLFLLLQLVPIIILAVAIVLRKQKDRLSSDTRYARRFLAPKNAKKGLIQAEHFISRNMPQEFYDVIFKTLQEYLGNRFHIPSGGITFDLADDLLKDKNVDAAFLDKLKRLFTVCDLARYAPVSPDTAEMQETLKGLKEVIDHLERQKV